MNGFGGWLQRFSAKLGMAFRRFMAGRYGTDRLSMVILCGALVASLLSAMSGGGLVTVVLWLLSYGLMFWAIFRETSIQLRTSPVCWKTA